MKNIVIAHHFEPYWEEALRKFGTSFEEQSYNFLGFLEKNHKNIDDLIITKFEGNDFDEEHDFIINFCEEKGINIQCIEYGYGWIRESEEYDDNLLEDDESFPINELNNSWCYGKRDYHTSTDVLMIEDWQKELKGNNVFLTGAFEGECICDIETVFESIGLKFNRINELIVGSGIDFDNFKIPNINQKKKINKFKI